MTVVRIIVILAIAYGSLFPFNFQFGELDGIAIEGFLRSWRVGPSRGDLLGNIILFVPFGFIGTIAVDDRGGVLRRTALVLLAGAIFASALQFAQLYLPSRTATLNDVFWNLLGTVVGGLGGIILSKHARNWTLSGQSLQLVPLFLLGCWAAARLIPFVPSVDFQAIKNSLKPLLLHPEITMAGVVVNAASWLAAAFMLQQLGVPRVAGLKLALIVLATFALKVLIVDNAVTASNVAGASLAWLLAFFVLAPDRQRPLVLVVILVGALVTQGLDPFVLRPETASLRWVPFSDFLNGSMYHNSVVMVEKAFLYGSLIYLLRTSGFGWLGCISVPASILACIEIAQLFFAHHTPAVTDPLLAILLGAGMMALERAPRTPVQPTRPA